MIPSDVFLVLRDSAARLPAILLSVAFKGSVIFVIVCAGALALKKTHPRLRSLLWLFAIAGYLLLLAQTLGTPLLSFEVTNPFRRASLRTTFSAIIAPEQAVSTSNSLRAVSSPAAASSAASSPAADLWFLAATGIWAAGAVLSYLRVMLGWRQLRRLVHAARPMKGDRFEGLLAQLLREPGIRSRVTVVMDERCAVPFTWRLRRPIIMLPTAVKSWPPGQLRSVLMHELRHIAWHDPLTRTAARVVCSLFWFVPFIWIAYELLMVEQEKACDRDVVERGVESRQYASCVLNIARASRRPTLFESVSLAGQRKRVLENRIRSIVRGGSTMKKGVLVFVAASVIVAGLIVLGAAASREKLTDEAAWARFVGTWVNVEYAGPQPYVQMLVVKPGFIGEDWLYPTDAKPDGTWRVKPKKVWTDREGNTYLQFFNSYTEPLTASGVATGTGRVLIRMDRKGQALEFTANYGPENGIYPEKIDPNAKIEYFASYFIYHRKK